MGCGIVDDRPSADNPQFTHPRRLASLRPPLVAASPGQAPALFMYIYLKNKFPSKGATSLPASWIQTQITEH